MTHPRGLHKAIKYFGSQEALAKVLDVSRSTIGHWLNGLRNLPDFLMLKIFFLTKGTIPLKELSHNHLEIYRMAESILFYTQFPAVQIPIKEIQWNSFCCPIYKNNENLMLSENDLHNPVFINMNNELITCECRVRANFSLGRKYIHVHKLNLPDVISGKVLIAKLIEALPISEKVAIGLAIERELGNRRGRRTDLELPQKAAEVNVGSDINYPHQVKPRKLKLVDSYPQVARGLETRKVAANIAGFSSHFLYGLAKETVAKGIPQLIQAMDYQYCTISKANHIAKLSNEMQHQALIKLGKFNGQP